MKIRTKKRDETDPKLTLLIIAETNPNEWNRHKKVE